MTTPTTTKRPSRASRAANKTASVTPIKPTAKPTARKPAAKPEPKLSTATEIKVTTKRGAPAVKVTTVKKAEPKGPSAQAQKRIVAGVFTEHAAALIASWDEKATGVSKDIACEAIRSYCGYVPHGEGCWSAKLGPRTVGRPAPKSRKSA